MTENRADVAKEMNALVSAWRKRQAEIMSLLPVELQTEFATLAKGIEFMEKGLDELADPTAPIWPDRIEVPIKLDQVAKVTFVGFRPDWFDAASEWCDPRGIILCLQENLDSMPDEWPAESRKVWKNAITRGGGPPCIILQGQRGNVITSGGASSLEEMKWLASQFLEPVENVIAYSRVPISEHKKNLIAFLQRVDSATRSEMSAAARIPEGSLGQVLRHDEFEQVERGRWKLRGK